MRVERVSVNQTCNQNCRFCTARRSREDPGFAASHSVRARIAECAAGGVEELVLTGGEPTLRRDLPGLATYAKCQGAETVTVETNGALLDAAGIGDLQRAGLDGLRVHVPAWGDACDAITRDPGGFDRTLSALREASRAGVRLQLAIPVVRDNAEQVAAIPAALARERLPVEMMVVAVPLQAPDPSSLATLEQATRGIEAVAAAARRVGLAVQLDPGTFLPPCAFEHPDRVAHLYTMTGGATERAGYQRSSACDDCQVQDRCFGAPTSALLRQPFEVAPIRSDRTRRRLSIRVSVQDQIRRELITHDTYRTMAGDWIAATVVRINFHCNQACRFCFVSTHLPTPPDADVRAAIEDASRGGGVLVLSGGEPTLNPRLLDYVRLGRERGATFIDLQTNAIRLRDPALVSGLIDAGLNATFVSLSAASAEVSDSITGAPGSFAQTCSGIDEIARTGLRLGLNFVFCEPNHAEFPRYVDLVGRRWPGAELTVSFVAPGTDVVPVTRELIPRYSAVLPSLREGLLRARAGGLSVFGFESMCGLPVCALRELPVDLDALERVPDLPTRGEFLRPQPCERCRRREQCWGIRRNYVDLYGTDELAPFE